MRAPSNCQFGTLAAVGGVLVVIGSVFIGVWSELFDFIVRKQLVLTPTSYSYDLWEDVPIPVYLEFYMFNWTNPEELKDPGSRPKFVEMGPYVFREYRKKVNITWNDNNSTVTFLQNRTWHFDRSMSSGSLDDPVTTINTVAITAVFALRNSSTILKGLLNSAFVALRTKLVITKTVGQFLFDGYIDPLLNIYNLLPPELGLPIYIPSFDKFGWFYTRNGSAEYDGVFNMYTGKDDITKFAEVAQWNYQNPTSVYESYCGYTNGSAGELFPPNRRKDSVSLFSSDICRSLTLTYKEKSVVSKIHGYRYWADEDLFKNLSAVPDNSCWCYPETNECAPHGAIDVHKCKWGAPAFVSYPHFLYGDPSYREAVVGMKPNDKIHQTFIDLEPRTGIPLNAVAALQVNVLLQPNQDYPLFSNVPKVYFPCMWFKESAWVDDEIGPTIRLVSQMPVAGYLVFVAMLGSGIAMLIIITLYYLNFRRESKNEGEEKLVAS